MFAPNSLGMKRLTPAASAASMSRNARPSFLPEITEPVVSATTTASCALKASVSSSVVKASEILMTGISDGKEADDDARLTMVTLKEG